MKPNLVKQRHLTVHRAQRGRTLIEVMVAITIGLMLTAGVISIYGANRQTFRTSADVQRMQAAGQLALDRLAYQIRMAGYAPLFSSWTGGFTRGGTGAMGLNFRPCSGGFTIPTIAGAQNLACQNNAALPDAIAVSYQADDPNDPNGPESGNFRDCLGAVVPAASPGVGGAVDHRLYIEQNTLMCATGANAGPLVPNIEDLQIRVREGGPKAGSALLNERRTQRILPPQSANADLVFAVELCVQVVSENTGLTTGVQSGTDCRGNPNFNNVNDGRLRRTFTQMVTLRNRMM